MTANLVTLNFPKTVLKSKQQLAKIHDFSLNIIHSAHNLGYIFDKQLTFSDQMPQYLNLAITNSPYL